MRLDRVFNINRDDPIAIWEEVARLGMYSDGFSIMYGIVDPSTGDLTVVFDDVHLAIRIATDQRDHGIKAGIIVTNLRTHEVYTYQHQDDIPIPWYQKH